jgi:hypothetical protein
MHFLAGPFQLFDDPPKLVLLLIRETDDVSLLHGNLLVPASLLKSAKLANPKTKLRQSTRARGVKIAIKNQGPCQLAIPARGGGRR